MNKKAPASLNRGLVLKPEIPTNQFLEDLKRLATLFDDRGRFEISNSFLIEPFFNLCGMNKSYLKLLLYYFRLYKS
jgi:hypothetical protein